MAVYLLDKNMGGLRTWLAHMESKLAKPIVCVSCNSNEIQRKLSEQQELQRDIEKHNTSVASILNLCDCLAPPTQSVTPSSRPHRPWRDICAVFMEKRHGDCRGNFWMTVLILKTG